MENIVSYILIMAVLVLCSAFFSATETAFSSLNKTRLRTLAENENKRAILACSLSDDYDRLLSTILIGNNIVNIAAASLGTVMFVHLYGNDLGATISTVVVTIVVLIFGEITPKSIAKDCPERFAMAVSPLLKMLIWVLTPLNFIFSLWKKLLSKIFKLEEDTKMSQEELLMLVEEVQQDGSIDQSEGDLLRNAIEFTEREAEDILTHRVNIEALPVTVSKEELANVFSETKFSRLLLYNESIDNIVGVVHQKDLYKGAGLVEDSIEELMSPPIFVLKSEKISNMLKLLQKNKSHVAVVLDEYGGTYGIVTMEDILEELVGEIWDEHDEITEEFKSTGKDIFVADGAMDFEDFSEHFDIKEETDLVSLGGWVMEKLGKIPEEGDNFEYENILVTVTKTDCHRVETVEVRVIHHPDEEKED